MTDKYTKTKQLLSIPQSGRKPEKSVKLTPEELKSLTELRETANSFSAFALILRIKRTSLRDILEKGSGSEKNIKSLRRRLSKLKTAA